MLLSTIITVVLLPALVLGASLRNPVAAAANTTIMEAVVADRVTNTTSALIEQHRSVSRRTNCYSGGQAFSTLGSPDEVQSLVNAACGYFSFYSGHTFTPGNIIQWCYNVPGAHGLDNNMVLMMGYKGKAGSFTPENSHYSGGLQAYCNTAMQWALENCEHGGYFTNHALDASGYGTQYWDVKLDPNEGSCADN